MHLRTATLVSLLLWTIAVVGNSIATAAPDRLAMVIGNSSYQELRPLANPGSDARALAERLKALGFTLVGRNGEPTGNAVTDLDERGFSVALRRFAKAAKGAEIALFYYAGHGMQFDGKPYLLPIDIPGDDLELVRRNAIELEEVLRRLDGKAELTVAVFDACREIPELEQAVAQVARDRGYGRGAFRGLARVRSKGRSRIVAYSGAAGQVVKDGSDGHSPYTAKLLAQLEQDPGLEVGDLFRQVAYQVGQRNGGQQPEVLIQGVPPRRYYLLSPDRSAEFPLSTPPLPVGWLQVLVDTPAASVLVNGTPVGEASPDRPLYVGTALPPEPVEVRVQAGDQTVIEQGMIQAGRWNPIHVHIPAPKPPHGQIASVQPVVVDDPI